MTILILPDACRTVRRCPTAGLHFTGRHLKEQFYYLLRLTDEETEVFWGTLFNSSVETLHLTQRIKWVVSNYKGIFRAGGVGGWEGGLRGRGHVYTYSWSTLLYRRNWYNVVKQSCSDRYFFKNIIPVLHYWLTSIWIFSSGMNLRPPTAGQRWWATRTEIEGWLALPQAGTCLCCVYVIPVLTESFQLHIINPSLIKWWGLGNQYCFFCFSNYKMKRELTWPQGKGVSQSVHPWWIHVNVWQNQYSIVK